MAEGSALKVITMNAHGATTHGITDVTNKRKKAIKTLVEKEKPHLITFQESKIDMHFWDDETFQDYTYIGHNKNDASILYNKKELFCSTSFYTLPKKDIVEINRDNKHNSKDEALITFTKSFLEKYPEEIKGEHRFCMAKMRRIDQRGRYFICISWHGPFILTHPQKVELLKDLLQYVDMLFKKFKIPVIMGGDFNIEDLETTEVIKNKKLSLEVLESTLEYFIHLVVRKTHVFEPDNEATIRRQSFVEFPDDIFIHNPVRLKIKMARDKPPLEILTINANGTGLSWYTEERETAIKKLVKQEQSHVILFQEYIGVKFWKNDEFRDYEYVGSCENRASILYNKQILSCETSFHSVTECEGVINYRHDINDAHTNLIDFINRFLTKHSVIRKHCLCMSKMRRKDVKSQQEFVCISWHGPDNPDVEKKNVLEDLLQTVDKWSKEYEIPVVMGGDFDISYEEAEKVIKEKKLSLTILKSENEVMIYFVVTKKSIFDTITDDEKTIEKERFLEDNHNIFDHSPVKLEINASTV